jgi:hypothetical protein
MGSLSAFDREAARRAERVETSIADSRLPLRLHVRGQGSCQRFSITYTLNMDLIKCPRYMLFIHNYSPVLTFRTRHSASLEPCRPTPFRRCLLLLHRLSRLPVVLFTIFPSSSPSCPVVSSLVPSTLSTLSSSAPPAFAPIHHFPPLR